ALEGCRFPRDIELDDSVAAVADSIGWQLDSLLIKALEDSGLDSISARDWRPAWERMVDSLGGVYDAATGEPTRPDGSWPSVVPARSSRRLTRRMPGSCPEWSAGRRTSTPVQRETSSQRPVSSGMARSAAPILGSRGWT